MEKILKKQKTKNIWLAVIISVLCLALVTLIILYSISMANQNKLKVDLENVYQKNFTELVDNVNNVEVKLSKVCASDYSFYTQKLLNEITKNATSASINLSSLPVSINGIDETKKFISQVGGFCETMANKLQKGESLTGEEVKTLENLKEAFVELKDNINKLSKDIYSDNIFNQSAKLDGDYNDFTMKLKNLKASDVEYPTMIYDGPFSDSTLNKKVKNLNDEKVSAQDAKQKILKVLKNVSKDNCEYLGETNGKFKTYDFEVSTINSPSIYIQVSQFGAKILTMTCPSMSDTQNYNLGQAKEIAINFAKQNDMQNMQCVWSDIVDGDAYINLAPVLDKVVIYPDLVKVKVDLFSGLIIGFDSTTYHTNHTQRTLASPTITAQDAQTKISKLYKIEQTRLCLAPLDYKGEVLCYECICTHSDEITYFYINAQTNQIENILKVVETDNGDLLI